MTPAATADSTPSGPAADRWPLGTRPVVREAAVLLLLAASAVLSLLIVPGRGLTVTTLLIALVPVVPLPWRHRAPVRVFVAVELLALGARVAFGPNGPSDLVVLVALYAVASRCSPAWTGAAVVVDVGLLAVAATATTDLPPSQLGGEVLGQAVVGIVVALVGAYMASRRAHLEAVEDRADRLERARELEAQAAVEEERRRIARELHDVVAHHVSVMTLHAGALQRHLEVAGVDAELTDAAANVRTTGQEAMQELARMLDVLHHERDDAPTAPQPTLRDLDGLVERMRQVGMSVELVVDAPPDDVSPGLALTVFRIAQEALTNTLRHAGPVQVEIELSVLPSTLVLTVRDHGGAQSPPAYPRSPQVGGRGLAGMRERAALYGGEVVARPHPEGGFLVRAELPRIVPRPDRAARARAAGDPSHR